MLKTNHELLKWINANSYRMTHYSYSGELIHLAGEQSVLLVRRRPV
ncbi:MAG: hypothetical protein JEZ10_09515 [Verrucomicrobia bacterium]|nr:hypothetical protein [Verrucomicrobiota bacterium]